MLQNSSMRWRIRTATGLTWAVAAAAAVYWGLRLSGPVGAAPTAAPPAPPVAVVDAASLARLLGAQPGPVVAAPISSLASRMQLQGVIADRRQGGTALIVVDGKPARPYRAGAVIEPGLVVQALEHRSATLGAAGGPAAATLEMPPLPSLAASGSRTGAASVPAGPVAPPAPVAYGAAAAVAPPLVFPQSAPLGGTQEPVAPITN